MHLIVDGIAGNRELLTSVDALREWLQEAVAFIGMTVIAGPYVIDFPGEPPGLSGVVILAESNITVHTFPEAGMVNVDIFSCRAYDTERAAMMVRDSWQLSRYGYQTIPRPLAMTRTAWSTRW